MAHRNSVGARKKLLPQYCGNEEPLDRMDAVGDRRCAYCGGYGYERVHFPRLKRRQRWSLHDECDEYDWRGHLGAFDQSGRIARFRYTDRPSGSGEEPQREAEADARGRLEPATEPIVSYGALADERMMAQGIIAGALYHVQNVFETRGANRRQQEAKGPRNLLVPLYVEQRLADMSVSGGGRKDLRRSDAFSERDAAVLLLVLLGYDDARIARALGLTEKQISDSEMTKTLRAAFRWYRHSMIHDWRKAGHATSGIAAVCDVSVKTVQRLLKAPVELPPKRVLWLFDVWDELPEDFREFLRRAFFEWIAPRHPGSDGFTDFYGVPRHTEADDPYHSWRPSPRNGVLTEGPQRAPASFRLTFMPF